MQMESAARVIEELTALLRRELASVSLYGEALEGLHGGASPMAEALGAMEREHARNARTLRTEIARLGGSPPGATAVFALSRHEDAGSEAALDALVSCEERALRSYEEAARRLPPVIRALVVEVLVPARRRHLAVLRSLVPALAGHVDCTAPLGEGTRTPPPREVAT